MKIIKVIWWVSLVVKIILAVTLPFSQDESYYWVWSKNLQLSYLDHPPMVAWLLWLGNIFEPFLNAVRLPAVILGHLTILIWINILLKFISEKKIVFWILLVLFSPLLGVGSIIVTPDIPLLFFLSLSLLFSIQIFEDHKLLNYFFLGLSLGLGFISKYHTVLFIPLLLINLILNKNYKNIRIKGVLITIVTGLIFSLPVLIWNFQNDFRSFAFQLDHGLAQKNWEPFWTYSYLVGQLIIIFPTILYLALTRGYKKKESLIFLSAWFPLVFFLTSSFKGPVEPNWAIMSLAPIFALAIFNLHKNIYLYLSYIFWGIFNIFVMTQVYFSIFENVPEKMNEARYFDEIKPIVTEYSPIYFGSYQMASKIWYETKMPTKKLLHINRADFFDELNPFPPTEKSFYIIKETWVPIPDWLNSNEFKLSKIKNVGEKFELIVVSKL